MNINNNKNETMAQKYVDEVLLNNNLNIVDMFFFLVFQLLDNKKKNGGSLNPPV